MSAKALGPAVRYRHRREGPAFIVFDSWAGGIVPGSERATSPEAVRLSVHLARLWPQGVPPGATAEEL